MNTIIETPEWLIEICTRRDRGRTLIVYDRRLDRPVPPIPLDEAQARALAEALVSQDGASS